MAISDMAHVSEYQDVGAVLNSPDARQELHRSSDVSAELGEGPTDAFVADSVIALHGDEHFARRRLESQLFTREARAAMELEVALPAMRTALKDHMESSGDGRADLMTFSRLILIRMSAAVVGLKPVEDLETADQLRALAETILNAVAVDWSTGDREAITRDGLEASGRFREDFYGPAREHFDDPAARANERLNLLSLLLDSPESISSEDVLFRESILFLIASSTTTTNALPHTIRELELWLEQHPAERKNLATFDFCRKAATEALRLHPPVPGLLRQLTAPLVLPSGRELAADEFIFLDLRASARDKTVFGEDADEFNPNRIVDKGVWPFGYTFGGGAHMCLGRSLAVGDDRAGEDASAAQGVLVRLLHEFYRWGVALDPTRPPRLREATEKNEYESFPVIFTTSPDEIR